MLPWPDDLPRGIAVKPDHEREATPSEMVAAERIVGQECERRGLDVVRVRVVNVKLAHEHEYAQRLAVSFTLKKKNG